MAYVLCERHGGNAAAFVCSHIAEAVIRPSKITIEFVPISACYDDELFGPFLICRQCAEREEIEKEGKVFRGENSLDRLFEIDANPICSMCLDEQFPYLSREIN